MSNLGGNSPSADTDKSNNVTGAPGAPGTPGTDGDDGVVQTIVAGTNIDNIDSSDPANPIINAAAAAAVTTTKGDLSAFDTVPNRLPVGTNDQVLTADSAVALGVAWKDPAGGDPLTTKGDVFGFDTDAARIPVGTNDQVLTADSTAALGVAWKTPAAGGAGANFFELPPDTGYATCGEIAKTSAQRTDATFSANLVWCDFIYFDGTTTINQIAVNNATASGGGTLTVALHPIASRLSIGTQDFVGTISVSTAANTKHTGVVSWNPPKGWYCLAMWSGTSITNLTMTSASTASGIAGWWPAGAWTKIGETEVERKAHIIRKSNYGTTPDLSGIDFNDLSIYDSANQEELTDVGTMLFLELRYA